MPVASPSLGMDESVIVPQRQAHELLSPPRNIVVGNNDLKLVAEFA